MTDQRNIILVGFMGTGKSVAGRIVARRLERTFVDMDSMIEERSQRKISDIFRQDGESAFRAMERNLVQELSGKSNLVIAAGGGVVINSENIADFSRTGVVICLTASPAAILKRVERENHRPLLENGDKAKRILDLLEARRPMYAAIPRQLDTTYLGSDSAAERILEIFQDSVRAGGVV